MVKCAVCVPAVAKLKPFQVYGNADGQTLIVVLLAVTAFTVNTNVAVESHPTALVRCAVCVPAVAKFNPFQV